MQKLHPPPAPPSLKKFTALFTSSHTLKIEILSSPLPFWKLGRRLNPPPHLTPSRKEGAHYGHTYPFVLNHMGGGGQTANFGKKSLMIIDNFPLSAFYFILFYFILPRPLRQLGTKE